MNTYPASRRSPPPPPPTTPPTHPSDTTDEGVAGRIGPSEDAYDALADMFLGELGSQGQTASTAPPIRANGDMPRRDAAPAAAERAGVELLILGHLPIMASAWASHYVRHAAGRLTSPVASLRLADGAAWLELMNAPAAVAAAATLNAALRAASSAEHWIIRADAGREREFVDHQRLTRITLLTGCNEAATVDAYRAVKQLAAEAEHLPALRVAVLGGTAAACRQAADRICDACHAFLEIEIEAVTCPGAIGTGAGGTELYHGPVEGDTRLILDRVGMIHRAEAAAEATAPAASAAAEEITATDVAIPAHKAAVESAETVIAAGVPRAEDLGLRPLSATCPYEPSVQLAMDEAGGLHLLIQAKEAGQLDAAVRALSIVAAWASDHRVLLGSAEASGEARPIQRHLLTAAPREARRLLDTDIRIHLCASAERAQHGWVLADLN